MSFRAFHSKSMLSVLFLIVFLFVHHIESKDMMREDVNIIPSLPGGALALKRTTILEELENYGITKMDPIISDFCHIIPEVGVNLGIQGTLPFDEWCKVGVVELMRESIRTVGVLIRDRITTHLVDTNPIAAQFVQKILTEPIGNVVEKVKEGHDALVNNIVQKKDSLMTNIASVVKNAIYTSGVNTGTFREFTKQIDFTVEATCEVGDVICDADKVVMIVSALADKRLIWESIVNRLDDPILTVFRGLNGLIHKVEKDVERRAASLSSHNRGEENSGGGNVIGPGGLNAGLSLT